MDQETRLAALEIAIGLCLAILRDLDKPQMDRAAHRLRQAISGQSPLSTVPGETTIAEPFALQRALALVQGFPLATGQA